MTTTSALTDLYALEFGRLRRLARRITGCRETAEDVVQDAFFKLSGRSIEERDIGLVVRTAQNLARDAMRAERVRALYASRTTPEQMTAGPVPPDEAAAGRQELGALLEALHTLPERTRRVFLLNKVDGRTYPEIAELLGVSVSTIEKEMISALQFCRDWRGRRENL
ncbi:sigma-70 family RNA polymerase sigma factor [Methylopila sp. M107]|uniref:RNA polymerase sigma factor n=1 Tax=Methylopila sp. M107 TaxID=1101190 RepID=UPI000369520E|nr:sigma-70 family RNA polymerase sigma factor [Methylopila sp. M107]